MRRSRERRRRRHDSETGPIERRVYKFAAWAMQFPFLYDAIGTLQKWDLRRRAKGSGWVHDMPAIASGWTQVRDLPAPAKKTFHQMWRKRR